MDRGAWQTIVHRGCKESDTTERLSTQSACASGMWTNSSVCPGWTWEVNPLPKIKVHSQVKYLLLSDVILFCVTGVFLLQLLLIILRPSELPSRFPATSPEAWTQGLSSQLHSLISARRGSCGHFKKNVNRERERKYKCLNINLPKYRPDNGVGIFPFKWIHSFNSV